ncbi:hypothetical protein BG011_003486 [Mortierella polycephala]|uniref:Uncharacterized protein n=1 Tax=Mortierella polycephala TaxID=41804 RepID=A0A9P6QD67_9FUNG|nr:hypothetical protein BG011_003486 [Mortierella polycephala]
MSILEVEFTTETDHSDGTYMDSNPSSARSSLNSIEMRYMNHLVGPGTTSSRLETSKRFVIRETDISRKLMAERRCVVQRQCEIDNVSDLLSLNFIFDDEFLGKCLPADVFTAAMSVPVPDPSEDEFRVLSLCSVYAARQSFMDTKNFILTQFQTGTLTSEMLQVFTYRPHLWQDPSFEVPTPLSLAKNEDTYLECNVKAIIFSVLGNLDITDHWTRDPLPTPQGFEEMYIPDYYGEKSGLPFMVVEVKRPEIRDDRLESDKRKLPSMMKIMLDRLLSNGVKDPVVIGILVSASRCNVLIMALEYEALYLCKKVGSFELPKNNLQLGLLLPALGPLHFIQGLATEMVAAIENRASNEKNTVRRLRRPSYYIKGIRIPVALSTLGK